MHQLRRNSDSVRFRSVFDKPRYALLYALPSATTIWILGKVNFFLVSEINRIYDDSTIVNLGDFLQSALMGDYGMNNLFSMSKSNIFIRHMVETESL